MVRELSGFYWDEQKNRYFPSSSKPVPLSTPVIIKRKFSQEPYRSLSRLSSARSHLQISRLRHEILCSCQASTSDVPASRRTFTYTLSAFSTIRLDDTHLYTMIGDNNGCVYSISDQQPSLEFRLPTAISTVSSSGSFCVVTTFGSPCKVVVYNASTTETFILSPGAKLVYDVWTSHFRDRSLALGMHNKGMFLPDINVSQGFQVLNTHSDVLAIHQQPNIVYTGTRSGILSRWDTRTATFNDKPLLSDKYSKTSIVYVEVIDDLRIIVSSLNGELDMFDLRYPLKSAPIMKFPGHVNSYSQKLAFTVDEAQEFLFAAGQDNKIRIWSLRNGTPLVMPSSAFPTPAGRLFEKTFPETVSAMQVINERDATSMLVSWGSSFDQYTLSGQIEPI